MSHTEVLAAVESAAVTADELVALTLTLIGEASCFSDQNSIEICKILPIQLYTQKRDGVDDVNGRFFLFFNFSSQNFADRIENSSRIPVGKVAGFT